MQNRPQTHWIQLKRKNVRSVHFERYAISSISEKQWQLGRRETYRKIKTVYWSSMIILLYKTAVVLYSNIAQLTADGKVYYMVMADHTDYRERFHQWAELCDWKSPQSCCSSKRKRLEGEWDWALDDWWAAEFIQTLWFTLISTCIIHSVVAKRMKINVYKCTSWQWGFAASIQLVYSF